MIFIFNLSTIPLLITINFISKLHPERELLPRFQNTGFRDF